MTFETLPDYSGLNLGDYIDDAVDRFKDCPYLTFYDRQLTYGEFCRQVHILANAFKKLGFKKGDFIHVWVQNSPETLIAYCAAIKIGAVAGPINGWWKGPEVQYLLNDSKGSGLVVEDQYMPMFDEIKQNCPHLETVIEIGDNPSGNYLSFEKIMAESQDSSVKCDCDPDDTAFIFYTSGTTGNPKGVLLSHKNVVADAKMINAALKTGENKNFLCFLPLFHVNAMLTCISAMDKGHQIVLRKGFSAGEFWEIVESHRINFWSAVPAVYQILLADPKGRNYDLSSMEFGICGAAPMTEAVLRKFEDTFGVQIVEGYGLTEGTCVSTINPRDGVRKAGSIGLPLPGQEVLIVDEDGNEQPPNERGEIVIRGDNVMQGYYNRPEATAKDIDENGFFHTGDVGIKDEDGYITIVDRIKDMIIRGGENIYPKEIDNALAAHPKITEAATVGVPDETMGEEVKVFVLPEDPSVTEEEVIEYCRDNLARFKVPKYVEILEVDFPRNPIGKVLKKELRKWAIEGAPKRKKSGATVADIFNTMEDRVNPEGVKGVTANYGYVITGEGGGEWTVCVNDGDVKVLEGLHDPDVTTTVDAQDWIDITLGKLDGMNAFTSGKLKVEGDLNLLTKATQFFKKYQPPQAEDEVSVADIFNTMEDRVNPEGVKGVTANYGYVITGEGGGEWTVCVNDGDVKVVEGLHDPDVTTTVAARDWIDITLGKLDGMSAFTSGKLKVEGDIGLLTKATQFFHKYQPPGGEAEEKGEELLAMKKVLSIPQRFATGPVM
ncbi:MAG: long-chain-fatty-acid--CoA ligase, partial [Thermodesulfobacteriota bacterium]